jgi:hypothetical protein
MNALIAIIVLVVFGGTVFLEKQDGASALALCVATSLPTLWLLARRKSLEDRTFLLRIFILGVLVRLIVGTVIHLGHMEEFFGGDANTYSIFGKSLAASWHGDRYHLAKYQSFVASGAGAWGMLYLVAAVYELVGENMLAVQFINASIGSATAIVVYESAQHIFKNKRVSRWACLLVCFWPSLILWSAQALKDGIIVLVLSLGILCTVKLMNKISIGYLFLLTACLSALLTLRFYTFYMMVAAVAGSFLLGMKSLNAQAFIGRFLAIVGIGLIFTWFGVIQYAGSQLSRYGNMQMVQMSREDMARSADSGFMKDVDVSTTEGALTAIPIGTLYLLFAPFPWQLASLRQSLPLPEMIVWWLCFPFVILGFWYGLKHRLSEVAPILIFTTMLTLAYSLVQGNVGTAYRQRSQLLVFYFIFLAVGAVIMKERAEDKRTEAERAKRELKELQAARIAARRESKAAAGG